MRTRQLVATVSVVVLIATAGACSSGSDAGGTSNPSSTSVSGASSTTGVGVAAGATVPADWPAELALPAKTTVIESTKPSATSTSVVARIDGDAKDVFDALKNQLTEAKYEIVGSTFTPSDKGGFGSISAKGTTLTVAIAFGPDPTGKTSLVTINLAQRAA
jgi:hypothetical protein